MTQNKTKTENEQIDELTDGQKETVMHIQSKIKKKLEKDYKNFNCLTQYVLDKFGVNANYQIFYMDKEEWISYTCGYELFRVSTELQWSFFDNIIKMEEPQYHKEIEDAKKKAKKEYGKILSLEEKLEIVNGVCIRIDYPTDFFGILVSDIITEEISKFIEIQSLEDECIDYVILIRKDRLSTRSDFEKFPIIAEEAFHIVEDITDDRHEHEYVVRKANELANEFRIKNK